MSNNLRIYITCLCFLLCFRANAQDEQAVRKVLSVQQAAWNAGDINLFMESYWKSDSLKFIGKSGITYGWQQTKDNYKKSYPDTATMGKLTFTLLEVKVFSSTEAYVLGKWHLQRSKGDAGGYFTLLFRKVNGSWVIVSDHTS